MFCSCGKFFEHGIVVNEVYATLFHRTTGLKATADKYRSVLISADNSIPLKKALDAGQISIQEYLTGISLYYDSKDRAIEAERDYQKAYAELSAAEL